MAPRRDSKHSFDMADPFPKFPSMCSSMLAAADPFSMTSTYCINFLAFNSSIHINLLCSFFFSQCVG